MENDQPHIVSFKTKDRRGAAGALAGAGGIVKVEYPHFWGWELKILFPYWLHD